MQSNATSNKMLWTGRIVSALVVLLLLLDSSMKLMKAKAAVEGTIGLGYPASSVFVMGVILLVSVVLYAIPQTGVLGAILLTGYLGGAVASNLRVSNPLLSYTLAPVYTGILVWGGLFLRDDRLRALIPLRRRARAGE